jgi:hypothetical protein
MLIPLFNGVKVSRGVAIFAKACFGHPSPSKRQKLNATANAFETRAASKAIITEISRIGNQTVRKLASLINRSKSSAHPLKILET